MIDIKDKINCCGCHACLTVCPKQCIKMHPDEEGFLYPIVDTNFCIDCGLCEKVCPVINQYNSHLPLKVYVAKNRNENVRLQSSSGGIFTLIAEAIINEGGIIFGARFDEKWNVIHAWTDTIEGIATFRGSKYVQSTIGNTYFEAKTFLKQGRKVLFSGTPCQIAGLKKFLRKEYDNLLTVEVVCHGVPSPLVWERYLKDLNINGSAITYVNFRSKKRGWKKYSYLINSESQSLFDDYALNSEYLQGFSLNLTIRPSCYRCPAKSGKSGADITLADCWGIEKMKIMYDDDKGISTVLLNTQKASSIYSSIDADYTLANYDSIVRYNDSIEHSALIPYCRKLFWKLFPIEGTNAIKIINYKLKNNKIFRIYNKIQTLIINKNNENSNSYSSVRC